MLASKYYPLCLNSLLLKIVLHKATMIRKFWRILRPDRSGKEAKADPVRPETLRSEERGAIPSEAACEQSAVIETGRDRKTLLLEVPGIDGKALEKLSEVFDIVRPSEDVEQMDVDYIIIGGHTQLVTTAENAQKIPPSEEAGMTRDEEFLSRAKAVVWHNIDNVDFSKGIFASEMYVSQSLLYKKIKSLTGMSTVGFIKSIRMEHALELLADPSLSISEISERCGFASVSYFGEIFRMQFGKSPSEYRNTPPLANLLIFNYM